MGILLAREEEEVMDIVQIWIALKLIAPMIAMVLITILKMSQ